MTTRPTLLPAHVRRRALRSRHGAGLRLGTFALALSSAALFSLPAHASGGDEYTESEFTPESHVPAADLPAYAGGQLGVVPGSYWRVFLVLAWRAANGHPLSPVEVKVLNVDRWSVGPNSHTNDPYFWDDKTNGVADWLAARARAGATDTRKISVTRDTASYSTYLNCPVDAFNRARQTLAERQRQSAHDLQWVAVWLRNQDAVFANCEPEGRQGWGSNRSTPAPVLPQPAPAQAPAWLVKDTAYQTAAALFYAGRYDEARQGFLAIAQDKSSPWQPLGAYLAARCSLRALSLSVEDSRDIAKNPVTRQQLESTRKELEAMAPHYAPAQGLIQWIDARLDPVGQTRKMAAQITQGPVDARSVLAFSDYLVLLDRLSDSGNIAQVQEPMTQWVFAMAGDSAAGAAQARSHLKGAADGSAASALWLAPLVENASGAPGQTDKPIVTLTPAEWKAALAVPASSPLYQHIRYHLNRLRIEAGQGAQADAEVSAMLAHSGTPMSTATRNSWLALKLLTAHTVDDFLAAAARHPVDDGRGESIARDDQRAAAAASSPASAASATAAKAPGAPTVAVDQDFPLHLFRDLPLALLKTLPERKDFPPSLRASLEEAIWTRAVVLGDWATADAFSDRLAATRATTAHLYQRFKAASTPQAKTLEAAIIFANTPELEPHLYARNTTSPQEWGCSWPSDQKAPALSLSAPAFLTAAQNAQARKEQDTLLALPTRNAYLAPTLLAWARTRPADPEAPKALHFFVAGTRNECVAYTPQGQAAPKSTYSRDAFRLLHQIWPNDPWTAKTKYHYSPQ